MFLFLIFHFPTAQQQQQPAAVAECYYLGNLENVSMAPYKAPRRDTRKHQASPTTRAVIVCMTATTTAERGRGAMFVRVCRNP